MRRRQGQTTTEYMLVIAVITIAVAAVMYGFMETFTDETATTGRSLSTSLTRGGTQ